MNITNTRINTWRVDEDGMLRVTAYVMKEGVYPYDAKEAGTHEALPGVDPVMEYIPFSSFTPEALASLEGKPVTVPCKKPGQEWHQWRDAGNTLSDGLTVGSIAGTPRVTDDGFIECDMLIVEPEAIKDIQSGALVEVSAGYDGSLDIESGTHNGKPYHATQASLRFNHVLLLPKGKGRLGYDVRIINNTTKEGTTMTNPRSIKLSLGNAMRTYRFTNEEDAAVAEEMAEEQRSFNAEAIQEAQGAKADLEARVAELTRRLEEQEALLAQATSHIESLMSPGNRESLAEELVNQRDDEELIAEEEGLKDERQAFGNALSSCRTMHDRRAAIVARVMNKRGRNIDDWSPEAIDGAFTALAMNARERASRQTSARVLNGSKTMNGGASYASSNRDRMLKPMQILNSKREARHA